MPRQRCVLDQNRGEADPADRLSEDVRGRREFLRGFLEQTDRHFGAPRFPGGLAEQAEVPPELAVVPDPVGDPCRFRRAAGRRHEIPAGHRFEGEPMLHLANQVALGRDLLGLAERLHEHPLRLGSPLLPQRHLAQELQREHLLAQIAVAAGEIESLLIVRGGKSRLSETDLEVSDREVGLRDPRMVLRLAEGRERPRESSAARDPRRKAWSRARRGSGSATRCAGRCRHPR